MWISFWCISSEKEEEKENEREGKDEKAARNKEKTAAEERREEEEEEYKEETEKANSAIFSLFRFLGGRTQMEKEIVRLHACALSPERWELRYSFRTIPNARNLFFLCLSSPLCSVDG